MKLNLLYKILLSVIFTSQIACVSSEEEKAFDILNDKMENGNQEIKGQMDKSYQDFEKALDGIQSTGGTQADIENIKQIQKQALAIKGLAKSVSNFFVRQSSELIKYAKDKNFGVENEGDNPTANHFYKDEDGYYHLFPLNHLTEKDNYEAATELFIGNDYTNLKGQFIVDSILAYRDNICMVIANYAGGNGQEWSFIPPNIKYTEDNNPAALKEFQKGLKSSLATVNPLDTALIKQIYEILTPPEMSGNHGKQQPWLATQFDHAPLVAAIAMFTAIRSDILQAENKAVTHIANRVSSPKFNFNKIEPLAFAPEDVLNTKDSINK